MRPFRIPLAVVALAFIVMAFAAIGQRPAAAQDARPQAPAVTNRYDWDGDGCSDIFSTIDDRLSISKGNCTGDHIQLDIPVPLPVDTTVYDQFLLPGDWDGDGCNDLIGVRAGLLVLFSGDCAEGVKGDEVPIGDGFDIYNFLVAPGYLDSDACPDLVGRRISDGTLDLWRGDCAHGFKGSAPIGSGIRWDNTDWLLGPGNLGGHADVDICGDLAFRFRTDGGLYRYPGDCSGDSFSAFFGMGTEWDVFDWILSGGDWIYSDGAHCPDVIGWSKYDPARLKVYRWDCAARTFLGGGEDLLSSEWKLPFAGDSTPLTRGEVWGDTDCNGDILPRDGQALLKYVLQLAPLIQTQPCPLPGLQVTVDGVDRIWGDWDCSGGVLPRDGQAVIKVVLVLPPISQTQPCPDIGDPVVVG